jgi:hypothetical protein
VATASFPMASIGLITLLRQLETMIHMSILQSPRLELVCNGESRLPFLLEYLLDFRRSVTLSFVFLQRETRNQVDGMARMRSEIYSRSQQIKELKATAGNLLWS